jgi:CDP-diacylglycerol--serine O-phosphatidyltransferase
MMLRRRNGRLKALPVNSLVPNILTVLALCAGMTGIRFALEERWEPAVVAIVLAAVFDGLDGRMARLLKGATRFGAELDSLSDFCAFGVAPAFFVYHWSAHDMGGLGWIAALVYATCAALRLARFNTMAEDPLRPVWSNDFFTGVAAPAGAGFAMLPAILTFLLETDAVLRHPALNTAWLIVCALLMISRIPTFSLKKLRVKREHVLPTLVLVGLLAALLVSYPWFTLAAAGVAYLGSIPLSLMSHRRLIAKLAAQQAGGPAAGADNVERLDRAARP